MENTITLALDIEGTLISHASTLIPRPGLRTDRRDSGDLPGLPINLQVLYFITSSGGSLFRNINQIAV